MTTARRHAENARYSLTVVWTHPRLDPIEETYYFVKIERAQRFYSYMASHARRISGMTVRDIQPC